MKKTLLSLSAFIFAAALVGCSADKEKSQENKDKSSQTETTAAAETTTEKDTEADKDKEKSGNTAEALSFSDIAGPYHKTGHMTMGSYPDELDPNAIEEKLKDDPMTISEDGTLHFCGKDYKLISEGVDGEDVVFSLEGSGFDMAKYKDSGYVADKDYEGPCAFVYKTQHMTVNDEDYPYNEYLLYLTVKGDESYFGYISVDVGEASDDDWDDWDWDDDDDYDYDVTVE